MKPLLIVPLLLLLSACASIPAVPHRDLGSAVGQAQAYLDRIAAVDDQGPAIKAVIAVNPDALKQAQASAGMTGPLAGKAILIKDNIETKDPMPTTAGSLALKDNVTGRDAPLVARLRAAGAVILGKANLSEWANMRSVHSTSGWSAVGGLTKNPHAIDRNACGSSSGSGAAVAAGEAWAAIGTETDGSITCPASLTGIVGFKPTVGLVGRTYVVPLSHSQDTPGPMATSVRDAAAILTVIAGSDPLDPATERADLHAQDFTAGLEGASLAGVRIGVLRKSSGKNAKVRALFDRALADLKAAGAVPVDLDFAVDPKLYEDEYLVLLYELRTDLNAYLEGLPGNPPVRSLTALIAFNKAHPDELRWFGQDAFEMAAKTTDTAAYRKARDNSLRLAGKDGIDKLLAANKLSLLVAPTEGPAWPLDLVTEAHGLSDIGAGSLPAVAGYPHLTVPMGAVEGLPVGLSFIGAQWDDKRVLEAGAAYERARTSPVPVPSLKRWGE